MNALWFLPQGYLQAKNSYVKSDVELRKLKRFLFKKVPNIHLDGKTGDNLGNS